MLSISKFRKFGKIQLLLSLNDFGLRPEERDHNHQDLSLKLKAARVCCILTPSSHKQSQIQISTLPTVAHLLD